MEGVNWGKLEGKRIFVKLNSGWKYSGVVSEVIDTGDGIIWIHLLDLFGKIVVFLSSEVVELVEK